LADGYGAKIESGVEGHGGRLHRLCIQVGRSGAEGESSASEKGIRKDGQGLAGRGINREDRDAATVRSGQGDKGERRLRIGFAADIRLQVGGQRGGRGFRLGGDAENVGAAVISAHVLEMQEVAGGIKAEKFGELFTRKESRIVGSNGAIGGRELEEPETAAVLTGGEDEVLGRAIDGQGPHCVAGLQQRLPRGGLASGRVEEDRIEHGGGELRILVLVEEKVEGRAAKPQRRRECHPRGLTES